MDQNVLYSSVRNKIKGGVGYKPCNMEITSEYLAYSQGSVFAKGVGGLVGMALQSASHQKNGVVLIPIADITQVDMKKGFGTAMVYVQTSDGRQITFACYSKKDMETVYELLKR